MLKTRFFLSWLFSSIAMFGVSIFWHGVVLNDLNFIPQPIEVFYLFAVLAYLVIGFTITFVFTFLSMGIGIRMKGWLMGLALGFFIYLVAFVLGVSFKGGSTEHVVMDFLWQMIEQGIGGGVVGFIYYMARRRDAVLNQSF